jgi:SAM-dependent methyltransferase
MLKMYHQRAHKGDSPELWEENWENHNFELALRFCENDPLRPLFERYARPGTTMLEGGCGQGHYVAYYAARGVRVVGLDFAQSTLARLRKRNQDLALCAGDVARLPFSDEAFDLYYSGGVVEHFEDGAEPALREARRVIRPDGVLLISVPFQSPLRRALSVTRKDWKRVSGSQKDVANNGPSGTFFQYAYTVPEFTSMLSRCGLRVIELRPFSILWGLYDLPLLEKVINRASPSSGPATSHDAGSANTITNTAEGSRARLVNLARRLVANEDVTIPIAGSMVRFLGWASANMMMYVCVRDESQGATVSKSQ